MNIKSLNSSYTPIFILIIAFNIISIQSKQIQTPSVTQTQPINMKLHSIEPLNVPQYKFTKVYRKQIGKIKDKYVSNFDGCAVRSPLVQFNTIDFYLLANGLKKPYVTDDIKDIIYGQYVLDAYVKKKTLYMMLVTGKVIVLRLNQQLSGLAQQTSIDTKLGDLDQGYFFQNNGDVCFANANNVIVIQGQGKTLSVIKYNSFLNQSDYKDIQKFQNVISLDQKYFAVAIKDKGVYINQRVQNEIKTSYLIDSKQFNYAQGDLSIVDIQYDRNLYRLYILDQLKGVSIFQLDFDTTIKASLRPLSINIIGCYMIYLKKGDTLYASCRDLVKVELQQDRVRINTISQSKLKVRQIYENEDFLIVAGKDMFELFYHGTLSEYIEDQNLDKLLVINNTWISINQFSISIGTYSVLPQRIECKMDQQSYLGTHRLQVKTLANCDTSYFRLFHIDMNQSSYSQEDDQCLYINYVDIKVWMAREIALIPVAVGLIILIVTLWIIGLGWCIMKLKHNVLRKEVDDYQLIDSGHVKFVQQDDKDYKSSSNYNKNSNREDMNIQMQKKQKQNLDSQQNNKDLYAIQ